MPEVWMQQSVMYCGADVDGPYLTARCTATAAAPPPRRLSTNLASWTDQTRDKTRPHTVYHGCGTGTWQHTCLFRLLVFVAHALTTSRLFVYTEDLR